LHRPTLSSLSLSSLSIPSTTHRLDPPAGVHELALELGEGRELAGVRGARVHFFVEFFSLLTKRRKKKVKRHLRFDHSPLISVALLSTKKRPFFVRFPSSLGALLFFSSSSSEANMFASCARGAAARLRANAAAALAGRTGAANSSRRGFASGGHGDDHHGVTYEGVTLHKPARWHSAVGTGMASLMW
jgi:hypothetical protein